MRWKSTIARFLMTFLAALTLPTFAAETEANGVFLVAKREMADPRFRESVVLVTQPRQGGPWGVIINKPLAQRLAEVLPHHDSLKDNPEVLYYGGPVMAQGLIFLARATQPPPRSVEVLKGVYFTNDIAWVDARLERRDGTRQLRVFAGYSGWSAGQLQNEMRRGDWYVVPADVATLFDLEPSRIWTEMTRRATAKQANRDEGGGMKDEEVMKRTNDNHGMSLFTSAQRATSSALIPHPSSFAKSGFSNEAHDFGSIP